jgi:hypothetical protein
MTCYLVKSPISAASFVLQSALTTFRRLSRDGSDGGAAAAAAATATVSGISSPTHVRFADRVATEAPARLSRGAAFMSAPFTVQVSEHSEEGALAQALTED